MSTKEFNPANPQAAIKSGYIAKIVNIGEIEYAVDTKELISCTARYYDYAIKKEPIFTAKASNPICAYYLLLEHVELKIGQVSIKQFAEKLETSEKNQHYIKFWNEFKPEYEAYLDIRELIYAAIMIHLEKNPEDKKHIYNNRQTK